MAGQPTAPRAAVDVGSNSVRLLVVDASGRRLVREMTVTRLGTGVDASGQLDDAALARTLDTIARYRTVWARHGVTDRVRIAATSAVRDASDRHRFFEGVRAVTGVDAEVLTGDQEAALGFAGVVGAVDATPPVAVLDIGGGSTELVVGDASGNVVGSVSLQLGCVRLTERHLADDPPTQAQIASARELIQRLLQEGEELLGAQGAVVDGGVSLVAVAGTATTVAALHLGLDAYEERRIHGTVVPAAAVTTLTGRLLAATAAERAALGPMQPGREDVVHGGALILDEVLRRFALPAVVASEADNLDGLVASLA